jgi:3-methyl-2-oxobutanoate hydroxymethyltransferase
MSKITIPQLLEMKGKGEKIALLTAYDYPFGHLEDEAGIEVILVGDSLGMTVLGYENTLPVTMDEMVVHTQAVRKAIKRALLIGDMPFLSYQVTVEDAIRNAGRFMAEGGADGVKLEGGKDMVETVRAIIRAGIPVMGHIGLTPQSSARFGGFKVRGKSSREAMSLLEDAKALEEAGVFSIILECIPKEVSKLITESVTIPTFGIGSGSYCDGQILVIHDILGLNENFSPRFVKQFIDLSSIIKNAFEEYISDVKKGAFPNSGHSFKMKEGELTKLKKLMKDGKRKSKIK